MELTEPHVIESLRALSREKRVRLVRECSLIARDEDLQIGGTPIPYFHIPLFIEKSALEPVMENLRFFVDAMVKLELHALGEAGLPLFERLMTSLTPGGRELVRQCSYESRFSLEHRLRRIDGFFDPHRGIYSIIEVNQAAPLANHYHDVGERISSHVLNELGFDYEPNLMAPHMLDWFLGEYRERFGAGEAPHHIALVIEHGYPPKFTDLPCMAARLEILAREKYGHELRFHTCFPYEVKLVNDRMLLNDVHVDMIWRNSVYMTGYREQGLDLRDYETILNNSDRFLHVNATRSWLTRTKELFAIIWDDDTMKAAGFMETEISRLRALVPPTFNLARDPVKREEILKERPRWMSKPTDSGFGKGIEFGASHSDITWETLLQERACDGFVFQRKIDCPSGTVVDLDEQGGHVEHRVEYDFNPHHVNGDFHGTALVRTSILDDTPANLGTMNLVSGGRLLPLALV